MPLKLVPPRPGNTPYWRVRGTYLGQYVNRSTKTRKRAIPATKHGVITAAICHCKSKIFGEAFVVICEGSACALAQEARRCSGST
jgi:hypothetical protein